MNFLSLALVVLICSYGSAMQGSRSPMSKGPGHYWRDYQSRIPEDALPAGKENFFIGQVLTHRVLVPVHIDGKSLTAIYSYNGVPLSQKTDFKILCTSEATQFRWISTNVDAIKYLLPSVKFIEGGADDGYPLFIGRALGNGRIGKVTIYYKWAGLAYVKEDGKSYLDYNYEVIAYK